MTMQHLRIPRAGDQLRVTCGWEVVLTSRIGSWNDEVCVANAGDVVCVVASMFIDNGQYAREWIMVIHRGRIGWIEAQLMDGDPLDEWYEFVYEIES